MPLPTPEQVGWVPNQQLAGFGAGTDQLAQEIEQYRQQQMMMGQEPIPEYGGGDPQEYLTNLLFTGQTDLARTLAGRIGIDPQAFEANIARVNQESQDRRGSTLLGEIGGLTRVGSGEVTGFGDFARDAASLGAIGYGTTFLGGGAAPAGGTGSATVSGSNVAAGATGGAAGAPSVAGAYMPGGAAYAPGVIGGTVPPAGFGAGAGGFGAAAGANVLGGAAASGVPSWVGNYLMPGLNAGLGIYGANQASDAMEDASAAAIAENARQFDLTRADQMPWITGGTEAINRLRDPAASFAASPGYEWARTEGNRGIENSFSARGGAQSGNALRALGEFNTGLAQQDYGNWFGQQLNLAGMGSDTARSVGALGSASASRAGDYMQNAGSARASGVLGATNALQTGLYDIYDNAIYNRRRRP